MTIRPLKDKVAVKYYKKEEEKSKGGLVLPDTAREEKPQQGEVVAIGNEVTPENGEAPVKVGDKVIFDKYAGNKITLNEEEYVILSIDDVLAVIED
ncbi:MAG TPA: co-chaperone GroES [Halanaerobiaceae bacterium]|jgi:chaperonin GroES|nr:co-chaperone GroES [Bacillota bacterium]HHU92679.1 co-chaperone GroES [Halanaerobiaceae bacterium]HOA41059.1 co-chaperone GroES [Halanaerobiales bacterium]HPZ63188.1 co-chaperone GroES [Halanaerobiales bacterium]HQD04280.1 co-chaperone GroES [Halanaerobiales bacterium]